MKRKLIILMAVAALFVTAIAAPVGAFGRRSLRAHMDLDFNVGIVTGEGAAPMVSWVGTLEFRGGTYDVVYYPTAPLVEHGDWVYFEENVRRIYPEFPVRSGIHSWDEYLPPLGPNLRKLVETYGG